MEEHWQMRATATAAQPRPAKEAEMLARVHLPEMGRDEVARALSEIQLPEFDIRGAFAKLEMPKFEMPDLEMPKFEMPHTDVRKAMAKAGLSFPGVKFDARPQWLVPAVGVGIAAAAGLVIAAWALLRDKALREPVLRAWSSLSGQVAYAIGGLVRRLRGQRTDLVALDIAPEVPSVPAAVVPASRPPTAVAMEDERILVESGEPC